MPKALFDEIFEGPDSVFGRVFGGDFGKKRVRDAAGSPTVRVSLTPGQLLQLAKGSTLNFKTGDTRIEVVAVQIKSPCKGGDNETKT